MFLQEHSGKLADLLRKILSYKHFRFIVVSSGNIPASHAHFASGTDKASVPTLCLLGLQHFVDDDFAALARGHDLADRSVSRHRDIDDVVARVNRNVYW